MSQMIANINGKKVYSDKEVDSIVNTRVTFTDGSWCDVATGQVVNKGRGEINIDSPTASGEKVTEGPKSFNARNLEVRDVVADLDVQVHQANHVEVTISGPSNEVKAIVVKQQGDTVVISGEGGESGGSIIQNVVMGGRRSVTRVSGIRGASVVIAGNVSMSSINMGGSDQNETKITVKVPKGAAVNVSGVSGQSVLGDTEGNLHVSTNAGDLRAGRVASANLNVQGSGDIDVSEVNGTLSVNVMGSGDVDVKRGTVSALAISVMGSGDVDFGGKAETATLSIMGSGDIDVAHVKNRPITSVMGSGDIDVGNW